MRYFASVSKHNALYVRAGHNFSQYFRKQHGGDTVEMFPMGRYDYRAVFSDGRVTVIPKDKLPHELNGWTPMPRVYFPSKGDWEHMQTKEQPKKKKAAPRKRKMTLAEMLEEMENA